MEFRSTVTMPVAAQPVEQAVEQLLDGFIEAVPETGPVVSGNLEERTVSVTFSFDAHSFEDAYPQARDLFATGASASQLKARPSRVEIELVTERDLQHA